ncbi:MAG: tetratricopeptide repeat protein [Candidatus Schekmanbacteria bacterium]|nr:tetratricopeptide repeat protein [Candidatus Schekmanbacteria bacterium]
MGKGGSGAVYLVRDLLHDAFSALKILREDLLEAGGVISQADSVAFEREFRTLSRLGHQNVVSVYDFGWEGAHPYFTMEYLAGRNIVEATRSQTSQEWLPLIAQALSALEYIHGMGLVHGDLKPENLRVCAVSGEAAATVPSQNRGEPAERLLKLTDFGHARELHGDIASHPAGTLVYIAPEMLRGQKIDQRADLYALGVVLYELATGRQPYDVSEPHRYLTGLWHSRPPSPRDLCPALPVELSRIILKLLEREATDRFPSARSVLAELVAFDEALAPRAQLLSQPAFILTSQIIGRRQQLTQLLESARGLLKGRQGVRLAVIVGEEGAGKSRLLREVQHRLQVEGVSVYLLPTVGQRGEPIPPFARLANLLISSSAEPDDPELRNLLGDLSLLAPFAPALRALCDGAGVAPPAGQHDRFSLLHAISELLLRFAKDRPFVILLDDLHLADKLTIEAIGHFFERSADLPVLIIATALKEAAASSLLWEESESLSRKLSSLRGRESFAELALERLTIPEVAELIASMLGLQYQPLRLASRVFQETDGIPLFVEEVVKLLVEDGVVFHMDGDCMIEADDIESVSLPGTIRQVFERRLERLSPAALRLLLPLALYGSPAPFSFFLATGGGDGNSARSRSEVHAALDETLRHDIVALVAGDEPLYGVTHHQFCKILSSRASPEERRSVHAAIAAWLGTLESGGNTAAAGVLAFHSLRAGQIEEAFRHSVVAGHAAEEVFAHEEAVDHYERALALIERIDASVGATLLDGQSALQTLPGAAPHVRIHHRLARLLSIVGRYEEGLNSLRIVLTSPQLGVLEAADVRRHIGTTLQRLGRLGEARQELEGLLESLSSVGGEHAARLRQVKARVLTNLANLATLMGEVPAGARYCEESMAIVRDLDEKRERAEIYNTLGYISYQRGDLDEALRMHHEALQLRRELNDELGVGRSLANLGSVLSSQYRSEEAIQHCQRAEEIFSRNGYLFGLATVKYNLSVILSEHTTDWDRAVILATESLRIRERVGDVAGIGTTLMWLGWLLAARGSKNEPLHYLERALELHRDFLPRHRYCAGLILAAEILLQLGDHTRAGGLLARAEPLVTEFADRDLDSQFLQTRAAVELERGDAAAAVESARRSAATAEVSGDRELLGASLRLLGASFLAIGDATGARAHLEHSIRLLDETQFPFMAARSRLALGHALVAGGNTVAAVAPFEAARDVFRALDAPLLFQEAVDGLSRLREEALPSFRRMHDDQERIRTLFRLGRDLSEAQQVPDMLDRLMDTIYRCFPAERAVLILPGRDGDFRGRVSRSADGSAPIDLSTISRWAVHEVFRKGLALLASDAAVDPRLRNNASVTSFAIRSILCVPLKLKGAVLGTIYLDSRLLEQRFSERDLDFLVLLANQAAVALDNGLLRERNRSILESLDAGILAVDKTFRVTSLNRRGEEILGVKEEVVSRRLVTDQWPGRDGLGEVISETLRKQQEKRHVEVACAASGVEDGAERTVAVSSALLRDPGGEVLGAMGFFRDITELRRMERQMASRRRLKAMGEFAAHVAHRMKNFLTGIRLLAEGVQRLSDFPGDGAETIARVLAVVREAQDYVSGELHPVRTAAFVRSDLDLRALVRAVLQNLEADIVAAGAALQLSLPAQAVTVSVNEQQVSAALRNVVLNALQAMSSGGILRLELASESAEASDVVIEVRDTGPGIAPELLDRIFEPFFSTDARRAGTGLWQVHRTMEQHRGHVRVSSEVGMGTVVSLAFPRSAGAD